VAKKEGIDDLAGLLRRLLEMSKKEADKTVIGIHGSPVTGLKRLHESKDTMGEWDLGEWGLFLQTVLNETGTQQLDELNKGARHYARGWRTGRPPGTGSIYVGKVKKGATESMQPNEPGYEYSKVIRDSMKVKKEIAVAGKTEAQQLKELRKYLVRQGIKIY
jgi:hypothetical protein